MAGLWDEVTTINYKDAADPADGAVDRVLDDIMAESSQFEKRGLVFFMVLYFYIMVFYFLRNPPNLRKDQADMSGGFHS